MRDGDSVPEVVRLTCAWWGQILDCRKGTRAKGCLCAKCVVEGRLSVSQYSSTLNI